MLFDGYEEARSGILICLYGRDAAAVLKESAIYIDILII